MANSLTNKGQEYMLYGTATPNGSLANLGTKLKLYNSSSTPNINGTGFTEVSNGNGYTTGGQALVRADYTLGTSGSNKQITIADKTWTASGGSIANIGGAYLTDASDNVLAWWERASALTLASGDSLTLTGLIVRLT